MSVSMFRLLQELARGPMTTRELAAALQVDPRTVFRALAKVRELMPLAIATEIDGRETRHELLKNETLSRVLAIVSVSVRRYAVLEQVAQSGRSHALAESQRETLEELADEIEDKLGTPERERLRRIAAALSGLDRGVLSELSELGTPLIELIAERRRVRFEYRSPRSEAWRLHTVSPARLLSHLGAAYLLGFEEERGGIRLFALHRMRKLSGAEGEPVPELQKAVAEWELRAFALVADDSPIEAHSFVFEPSVAKVVAERRWHLSQTEPEWLSGGRVRLRFSCCSTWEVENWVASYGTGITVEAPASLRRRMRDLGDELAARYRKRAPR